MRIDTLYIEKAAAAYDISNAIRQKLEAARIETIDDYQDFFARKKTPYLNKRAERNLFIAVKRGALVREAPAAYGFGMDDLHYYYIHAFNCIYECEYCYLQGYFSSPDLIFFVNHDEIIRGMENIVAANAGKRIWFHAGEFSDSLALSHLSLELPLYWKFFQEHPGALLELRTKSINLAALRALPPLTNVVVSFSLSLSRQAELFDREAPGVMQRLSAMQRLKDLGFALAIHFDPIIYSENFAPEFAGLVAYIAQKIGYPAIEYVSLGVVRFARDVFREAKANYPESAAFARHFIQGEDQKMRYIRPLRLQLLESARDTLKKHGCPEEKIYFCME